VLFLSELKNNIKFLGTKKYSSTVFASIAWQFLRGTVLTLLTMENTVAIVKIVIIIKVDCHATLAKTVEKNAKTVEKNAMTVEKYF